jgi:hypothetical protein
MLSRVWRELASASEPALLSRCCFKSSGGFALSFSGRFYVSGTVGRILDANYWPRGITLHSHLEPPAQVGHAENALRDINVPILRIHNLHIVIRCLPPRLAQPVLWWMSEQDAGVMPGLVARNDRRASWCALRTAFPFWSYGMR